MGDISLQWNNQTGYGDWAFSNGDLQTGDDLETSVLLSLFSDRRATPDFTPTDGDLRGVWFDTYEPSPLGSNLWQLERAKISNNTTLLLQARDYCKQALQWMIDDGIVDRVSVSTFWITSNSLGITVTVTEPTGRKRAFDYSYAWNQPAPALAYPFVNASLSPTLDLDFMSGVLDSRLTFARASTASYFDSTGTLQQAAVNAPRFDYDPATLALHGVLFEEARTNYVLNPRAEGVVDLSYAQNWGQSEGSGVTPSVIGTGTEDGIPYVDVQWSGTTTSVGNMNLFFLNSGATASAGQDWTASVYVRVVGGDFTNLSGSFSVLAGDNGTSGNHQIFPGTPTDAPLRTQRWVNTFTASSGTTAISTTGVQITNNAVGAINVTLRIGAPQVEQGPFPTSIILPPVGSPGVSSRAADTAQMSATPWIGDYTQGLAIAADFYMPSALNVTAPLGVFQLSDGSINNLVQEFLVYNGATDTVAEPVFEIKYQDGIFQGASGSLGRPVTAGLNRGGITLAPQGSFTCANGVAGLSSTSSVNMPINLNVLDVGFGNGVLNGWMQRLRYWPRYMPQAELIGHTQL